MSLKNTKPNDSRKPPAAKGFSILELVVVMAVLTVICGIGVPTIASNLRVYQLNSAAAKVADQLKASRFAAIRRNTATACYVNPASNGYQIWTDTNGTGVYANNEQGTLISGSVTLEDSTGVANAGGLASALGVTGMTTLSGNSGEIYLTFDPRGAVSGNTGVNVFYVGYPGNPANGYRAVVLLPSGSVQVWMPNGSGGWVQAS